MQQELEEKGYLAAGNTGKAVAVKGRAAEAASFADLVALSESLDQKIKKLEASTSGVRLKCVDLCREANAGKRNAFPGWRRWW